MTTMDNLPASPTNTIKRDPLAPGECRRQNGEDGLLCHPHVPDKNQECAYRQQKMGARGRTRDYPTPQTYSDQGLIIGGPENIDHHPTWAKDIPSSGEEDDEVGNQNSMQTDITGNLAEHLMNKDERLANLYSSLAKAGNLVQAMENGGELDDARENQYITGCMMGLTNALLQQPYRINMEQQAELLKTVLEINKTVTTLSTLQCPPYSCRNPVIPVESGGIQWSPVESSGMGPDSSGFHRIAD